MFLRRNLKVLTAILSLSILCACADDDPTVPCCPRPPDLCCFPESPDELVQDFQVIYETMDLGAFARLLHPLSEMQLQPATTANYPTLGPTLDRVEDVRIHQRMFSQQDCTDPDGEFVPGIRNIVFQTLARRGTWQLSNAADPFPQSEHALYDVDILLDRGAQPSLKVQGQLRFFVTSRDSTVGNETKPYYQLRGLTDLTWDEGAGKSATTVSWGRAKALFR